MSNNIPNIRQVNVFNYAQNPQNSTTGQISCRLCNRVFMNNQSLITHIESHMSQEEFAIRRLFSPHHFNSQRELITNHLQPNGPVPMVMQETRTFADSRIYQAPPQPMVVPQPGTNPVSHASSWIASTSQPASNPPKGKMISAVGNNAAETPQLPPAPTPQKDKAVSLVDGTKDYLKLLEKPIKKVDLVPMHGANSVNLALKLKL